MNIKLLILLGITSIPLLSIGQNNPVFFNKGKMCVYDNDPTNAKTNTMLYVQGSFVISRDETDVNVKSEIKVDGAKIVIKGDLIQKGIYFTGNPATVGEHGFVIPSPYTTANASRIVFNGTQPQRIYYPTNAFDSKWKGSNYINLPDIEVNNTQHLTVAPEIGLSAQNIHLPKGRLILDSRRMHANDIVYGNTGGTNPHTHHPKTSSLLAHLYLPKDANVNYNRTLGTKTNINEFGAIEVRLAVDSLSDYAEDEKSRSIVGMGSPFMQMRADYFMYNFLMHPFESNILGYWKFSNPNPETTLSAGLGFVIGIDLRGSKSEYYPDINPIYAGKLDFDTRNRDKYSFSRFAYTKKNNMYPLPGGMTHASNAFDVVSDPSTHAAYQENIVHTDVEVHLKPDFNYFSNPFTVPLDLDKLLTEKNANAADNPWKVDISSTSGDILPYAWIMNPSSVASGTLTTTMKNGVPFYESYLHATYTYFLMKKTGGTYSGDEFSADGNHSVIAPLQMFLVYGNKENPSRRTKITIPESERVLASGTQFLRSTPNTSPDDFLFEVNDQKTKAYDRAAIVLRTLKEVLNDPLLESTDKAVSSVLGEESDTRSANLNMTTSKGKVEKTINSALYTRNPENGNDTESLILTRPEKAESVTTTLYLSPSQTAQDISIKTMRLQSMDEVKEIWLIDHLKNKEFELSTGKEYLTTVSPSDKHDRFTIKFKLDGTTGIEEETETAKNISSHYSNGLLTVKGFEDSDMGSMISIYDVQGRMLRQAKVDRLEMTIYESFTPGAYIVKVVGNKSYVSKFLAR